MKVQVIQSDKSLIVTTSSDVSTVARECLVKREMIVTVQESTIVHDFNIISCNLLHLGKNMLGIMAYVSIGGSMIVQVDAGIIYNDRTVTLSNLVASYLNKPLQSDESLNIIRPLVLNYVESHYKPEIHQFYEQNKH